MLTLGAQRLAVTISPDISDVQGTSNSGVAGGMTYQIHDTTQVKRFRSESSQFVTEEDRRS
jgi:hypothetical protein